MNDPSGSRVETPTYLSAGFCAEIMNYRHFLRTLTALIGLLMLSLSALAQQPAFLTNGLVAYYPLNGNGIDRSGNEYNGVQSNIIATTNRFGVGDGAKADRL
jgi:hypothetical protein